MRALSHITGTDLVCSTQRHALRTPGRSAVSHAHSLRHHSVALRQRLYTHKPNMQLHVTADSEPQKQNGTSAAHSTQLPQLPALDGKCRTCQHVQHLITAYLSRKTFFWLHYTVSKGSIHMHCLAQHKYPQQGSNSCCRFISRSSQIHTICQLADPWSSDGWQIPLH